MKKLGRMKILLTVLALCSTTALASDFKPYSQAEFQKLQDENKTVILAFHHDGCSVSNHQDAILSQLVHEDAYETVNVMDVDYHNSEDLQRGLGVSEMGTLVIFKGADEVARTSGFVDKNDIVTLLQE